VRFLIEYDVKLEARHLKTIVEAATPDEALEKLDEMVYDQTIELLNNSEVTIEATDWEEESIREVGEDFHRPTCCTGATDTSSAERRGIVGRDA